MTTARRAVCQPLAELVTTAYICMLCCYSVPVRERNIAIGLSVCVCVCVCLSVREHISETAGPIFKNFVQVPCGRGSVLFWRRCDTSCTSGFVDDVTLGRNGPYGDAWKAQPRGYYH